MKATVKQIFNEISNLNPEVSTISSLGSFVSESDRMVSDSIHRELLNYLPKDSLAYSILFSSENFSEKQLWTIAYELEKTEYAKQLAIRIEDIRVRENAKKEREMAKRAARRTLKRDFKKKCESLNYVAGQKVSHAQFGTGVITEVSQDVVNVFFDNGIEKQLMKAFAKLTIM